jgi:hypothetical protein
MDIDVAAVAEQAPPERRFLDEPEALVHVAASGVVVVYIEPDPLEAQLPEPEAE